MSGAARSSRPLAACPTSARGWNSSFWTTAPIVGGCAVAKPVVQANVKTFTFTCPTETATTYGLTATGVAAEGMNGFVYTVDQANVQATTGTYWGKTSATCWITRKDGSCT